MNASRHGLAPALSPTAHVAAATPKPTRERLALQDCFRRCVDRCAVRLHVVQIGCVCISQQLVHRAAHPARQNVFFGGGVGGGEGGILMSKGSTCAAAETAATRN
jgi:hypothetical protein